MNQCRSCGSDDYRPFFAGRRKETGQEIQYYLCGRCGLIFHLEEIPKDYYREQYRVEVSGSARPTVTDLVAQAQRVRALAPYLQAIVRPGILALDVGSSAGVLVEALKGLGAEASGVEPSEAHAEFQKERGNLVYRNSDEAPRLTYDLVTCIHTLEHMEDPFVGLWTAQKVAFGAALLLLEVPHALYSPSGARLAHPCLFTPEALRPLLLRTGWQPLMMTQHVGTATHLPIPSNILALCKSVPLITPVYSAPNYDHLLAEFLLAYRIQTGQGATVEKKEGEK
jgi:hypothetical protein